MRRALVAALIPSVNGLMVVGLVQLPGMMTGQILAGQSPLLAVRYQIVVAFMLAGATAMTVGHRGALVPAHLLHPGGPARRARAGVSPRAALAGGAGDIILVMR